MFMPQVCVVLPVADRAQLAAVVTNGNTPQKLAVRARILLMLAALGTSVVQRSPAPLP
jgi:hypothetical protein